MTEELTPDQQKDRDRLKRYVERKGLVSLMSNAKWEKLIAAVGQVDGYVPRFRTKTVREEFNEDQWEQSWPHHIPTYIEVEWIDLDPVIREREGTLIDDQLTTFAEPFAKALESVNVEFEKLQNQEILRVWGYKRSRKAI